MKGAALALILVVSQPALANDFAKFYKPYHGPGMQPLESTEVAEVLPSSGDGARDVNALWERGFAPVGVSTFNGPMRNEKDALSFANKIHARYIVILSQHTGSRQGAMATPLFGSLVMTPLVQERFDQMAVYFAPVPHKGVGVTAMPLSDEQKARLGTNKGFVVRAVRKGSPAYDANLVPGDVVTGVNGNPADMEDVLRLANATTGPVRLGVIRMGQPKELSLTIGQDWR